MCDEKGPFDGKETHDVLREAALADHERLKTALWDHLIRLENNVLILEDIVSFPGRKMLGSGRRVLDWVGENLYEYTIIVAWRLWGDTDRRSVTLGKLRRLLWDGIRAEYREALRDRIRHLKPAANLRDIFSRCRRVRHGRLAHIDEHYRFNEGTRPSGVSISELRRVSDFLKEYFNGLQFGVHSHFGLVSFESRPHSRSNVQRMMELLVLNSAHCVRYDQRDRDAWWRSYGATLTPSEVEWLSDLRMRYGLPGIEAPDDG